MALLAACFTRNDIPKLTSVAAISRVSNPVGPRFDSEVIYPIILTQIHNCFLRCVQNLNVNMKYERIIQTLCMQCS
jgi:hypothetical protein